MLRIDHFVLYSSSSLPFFVHSYFVSFVIVTNPVIPGRKRNSA
ncbi:putative membrane protein [Brevibacillus laterosporus GI-9]|nr:putative membrane protein [Brevibacillus laterosporus GI-9]